MLNLRKISGDIREEKGSSCKNRKRNNVKALKKFSHKVERVMGKLEVKNEVRNETV